MEVIFVLEEKRLEIDRLTKQLDHMEQELLEKFCDVGKFVLEKIEKENREIDQLVDQVIEVKKELSRVKGEIRCPADVDFMTIARATSGASGAELANRINEAALRAVRMGRETVSQADLEESVETVIAGYQRKNAVLSEKERRIVSYHEIGHALVAAKQSNSAPVTIITIVPRTSGVLGCTMQVDEGEHYLMSKEEIENKIESEKMIFLLYFAVNAQQRSKGYGSQIIHELKQAARGREIILNVEKPDQSAENNTQRVQRITFYERNGFCQSSFDLRIEGTDYLVFSTNAVPNKTEFSSILEKYHIGKIQPTDMS